MVWECKPTWEEQLKHDLLVASARGHVDVFFYENLNEQIARKAAPAAAHAAYAAVHFTSAVLARLEACEFRLPASEPIPRQLLHPHLNIGVEFRLGGACPRMSTVKSSRSERLAIRLTSSAVVCSSTGGRGTGPVATAPAAAADFCLPMDHSKGC